jgi:glucoamylase
LLSPAVVHWSADGWQTSHACETRDTGLSVHVADLPVGELPVGTTLHFTFYWPEPGNWEGLDFDVQIGLPG